MSLIHLASQIILGYLDRESRNCRMLLITAGSEDLVAPVVIEQIHPFVWVNSKPKYLALFKPGTHFATSEMSSEDAESIPSFLMGQYQEFGREYFKGLTGLRQFFPIKKG